MEDLHHVKVIIGQMTDDIERHANNIMNAYTDLSYLFWIAVLVGGVLSVLLIKLLINISFLKKRNRLFEKGISKEVKNFLKKSY